MTDGTDVGTRCGDDVPPVASVSRRATGGEHEIDGSLAEARLTALSSEGFSSSGRRVSPHRSRVAIVFAALLFSTGGAAIKCTDLTAWQIAAGRSAVAALVLWVLLPESRRVGRPQIWAAGLAYAATLVLYAVANKLTTAAAAIWLQATAPLYLLVLAPRLLGERVRPRDLLLGAVLAGATLILFIDAAQGSATALAPRPVLGNLVAAASGLTFAIAVLAMRHLARDGSRTALPVVVAGNVLAFLIAAPLARPLTSGAAVTGGDSAVLLYLGVVQVGLAYWCLNAGLRAVPAFEAGALLLVEPAMNPVWTWMLTGERPGWLAAVGGLAIMVATFVHATRSRTD